MPLESVHSVAPSEGIFFSRAIFPTGSLKSISFVMGLESLASRSSTVLLFTASSSRKVSSEIAEAVGLSV